MSFGRRILFGVSAGTISRFVSIALRLVLIPVLFRAMGDDELGVWFVLMNSGAFLALLTFGIPQTLNRRIALASASDGVHTGGVRSTDSVRQVGDLIATGKRMFRWASIAVFGLSMGSGLLFLSHLELDESLRAIVWPAWGVMCLGYAVSVWYGHFASTLVGLGHVGWDAIVATIVNVVVMLGQIVAVLAGMDLLVLAWIQAGGSVLQALGLFLLLRRREPDIPAAAGTWQPDVFKSMVRPCLLTWLTGLGGWLALHTDQYFIASFEGVASVPAYHATYQIVSNLYVLAIAAANMSVVFISQLWKVQDFSSLHSLLFRNLRVAMVLTLCGGGFLLAVGQEPVDLWLGEGHFPGMAIVWVFVATAVLQSRASVFQSAVRATEFEVFAVSALIMGVLNAVLTWILILRMGLVGVALGTLLAQLATFLWYAEWVAVKRFKIRIGEHIRQAVVPGLLVGVLCVGVWFLCDVLTDGVERSVWRVGIALALSGGLTAACLWVAVFHVPDVKRDAESGRV